jgi:hypothetical protein
MLFTLNKEAKMAPTAPKRSQEFISKSDDEDNFQATDEDIKPKSLKKKVVVQAKKVRFYNRPIVPLR